MVLLMDSLPCDDICRWSIPRLRLKCQERRHEQEPKLDLLSVASILGACCWQLYVGLGDGLNCDLVVFRIPKPNDLIGFWFPRRMAQSTRVELFEAHVQTALLPSPSLHCNPIPVLAAGSGSPTSLNQPYVHDADSLSGRSRSRVNR